MPLDYAYSGTHIYCPTCQADLSTVPVGIPCPGCGNKVDYSASLIRLNGLPKAFLNRFMAGLLLRIVVLIWWAIGSLEAFAPSRWIVIRFLEIWADEVWLVIALLDLAACMLISSRTGTYLDNKMIWLRKLLWMSSGAAVMIALAQAAQTLNLIAPIRMSFMWPYIVSNMVEIPRALALFFILQRYMRLDGATILSVNLFWLTWAYALILQLYSSVWMLALAGLLEWPSMDFDSLMNTVCLLELPLDAWACSILALAAIRAGRAAAVRT